LACQDELFMSNPLDVKVNDEHASDFVLHLSRLFDLSEFGLFHSNAYVQFMLSSLNAYQIITIDVHLSSGPS
jgi:hypothetical protein